MKKWYQSKVLWVAVIQAVVAVVAIFATQYPELGGLLLAKSVLDIVLRTVTNLPIGDERTGN